MLKLTHLFHFVGTPQDAAKASCYYGSTLGYDSLTDVPPDVPSAKDGSPASGQWRPSWTGARRTNM